MKDLNLGPESKRLIEHYERDCVREPPDFHKPAIETLEAACRAMADMLKRWNTVCWCWPDNCPAQICEGPHFKVVYKIQGDDRNTIEVIEPYNKLGSTHPDVPFTVVR